MKTHNQNSTPDCNLLTAGNHVKDTAKTWALYDGATGATHTLLLLLAIISLLMGTSSARADISPPGCGGSGLGISLITSTPGAHIGDTVYYSVIVYNLPFPNCDAGETNPAVAGAITAYLVTPNGVTNNIPLRHTFLAPGDSDYYTNVVSYVVRAQDILTDGTVRATAVDKGDIHQNIQNSQGGGNQGVNTVVYEPCVQITAQCVGGVGENGAITFTGTVTNCGNNALDVTVVNFVNSGNFPVLSSTHLDVGRSAPFSGSWVPSNPCQSSAAVLTALATDSSTSNPKTVTNSTSITCQNTLTPGIVVTQNCPPNPTSPGGTLTYSGTVSNAGNITLTNVIVTNDRTGTTPVFSTNSLAPGVVAKFTGSYTAPTNCSVTDTLTATATSRCGVPVSNSASTTCPVLTIPRIAVTLNCPGVPATAGGVITYSGTVSNPGNVTLNNVAVIDSQASPSTVLTVPSLPAGASANFTASFAVPANACSVSSTATASGSDACTGTVVSNSASATCPITTAPAIAVTLACPAGGTSPGVNIAQGQSATQSSTYVGPEGTFIAGWAVDGNTSGIYQDQSMSITLPEPNAWWQVDLGSVHNLQTINIWGRTDYPQQSVNMYVLVSDSPIPASLQTATNQPGVSAYYQPGNMGRPTAFSINRTGRYVKVQLAGTGALALPEVQVYEPPSVTNAGPIITYTGTVRNSGNVTLNNVVVVNDHPVPNTVVLTVPSLAAGASANFTASFNIPLDICSVSSTVKASGSDVCGDTVNATNSATCPLVTSPGIVVTQNCPPNPTSPGGTLTYSGTVSNAGNITLTNVVVTNDRTGTTPVFSTNSLAPGVVAKFTGSYTAPTNCSVTDTLTATATSRCGVPVSNSASTTCPVLTIPRIAVTLNCPGVPATAGGVITYSGTVSNPGNVTLNNVAVIDSQASPSTVLTVPSLPAGASANFTASFAVPANACSVSSTATASGSDACTGTVVSNSASATCPITTAPAIAVTLACPAGGTSPGVNIAQGQSATQSSTYVGPEGTFIAGWAVDGNTSGIYQDQSMSITLPEPNAWWQVDLGSVHNLQTINIWGRTDYPQQSVNMYVLVSDSPIPASLQTATNQPGVSAYYQPGNMGRPTAFSINRTGRYVKVQLAGTGALALPEVQVYEPPSVTNAGPIITYTGTVRNSGNVTLNNVVVVNDHPVPNTVVLTVPSLAAGASANFTASFNIPLDICSVSSTVKASGSDVCGDTVNATNSATCPLVTSPGIVVTQNCPPNPTSPGGTLTYSGTVSNAGNITLTNVVVTNDRTGTSPVFSAPTLAPGAVLGFTGSYPVPANSACAITSTLTGSGYDKCSGTRVAATASSTCPLLTSPLITVTQTCPANPVSAGGILTYSGTVRNAGNVTLTNVVVVNNRPADNTVIFTAASLAPGASANFTGSYEVPINCCVVWSTATASGKDTCTGTTVTDTDTTTCTVLTTPKIAVTKVCPPKAVQPGDMLQYSGTVSNAGNITLINVTVVNSQPSAGSPVFGPISLAPGESANYYASYLVPPDFCGADTVTAQGLDVCFAAPVASSVATTCPVITTPRIAVTKHCPSQTTPRGGVFTYTGTVSNPGNVTLINVVVTDNYQVDCYARTNGPVIGPITLAPGASTNFSGSYTAPLSCCEVSDTLTASGQDRCAGTLVTATATAVCPLLSTPRLTVTRLCPASPVPVGGVFAYSGSVSNAGDVVLTNVFVVSSQPEANTSVLGPITLAPGEAELFSGSYTVTANSNPSADTVTANGTDICQGRTVSTTADCSGTIGPLVVSSVTLVNGTATVSWTAKAGVTYRLQCTSNFQNSVWNTVPGDVTASGNTASKSEAVGSTAQRYYRVIVVQ